MLRGNYPGQLRFFIVQTNDNIIEYPMFLQRHTASIRASPGCWLNQSAPPDNLVVPSSSSIRRMSATIIITGSSQDATGKGGGKGYCTMRYEGESIATLYIRPSHRGDPSPTPEIITEYMHNILPKLKIPTSIIYPRTMSK